MGWLLLQLCLDYLLHNKLHTARAVQFNVVVVPKPYSVFTILSPQWFYNTRELNLLNNGVSASSVRRGVPHHNPKRPPPPHRQALLRRAHHQRSPNTQPSPWDDTFVALVAVDEDIQWPLTRDITTIKLDSSHYFFSFMPPRETDDSKTNCEDVGVKRKKKKKKEKGDDKNEKEDNEVLSYGLTIVSKGQEELVKELDGILETYSNFLVQRDKLSWCNSLYKLLLLWAKR
ncbi:protein EARLY-RESPONSIVE TO DEHYDRATION 7, chloroplastic [Sesamum alatum]|uniref:Protein EARLY-RESPONSIVE TO DEHYDRATION 7, chloroplastic n=1 Tax=Sesamum alatum TaxID=300844 RepID=A0AAE1Y6N7_9LAMI|nr:protein EARLY-RESPONSIVE TO DEHYDRATION 7, chloroplastic [Sesamum alatum]